MTCTRHSDVQKRKQFLMAAAGQLLLKDLNLFESPLMGTKKTALSCFSLHKRASRMPGPHSLAALSVAMRAKSSWSKTVF